MELVQRTSREIILASEAATLPAPTSPPAADDPRSLAAWDVGGRRIRHAEVALDAASGTSVTVQEPVELIGFLRSRNKWRRLGVLNNGEAIVVDAVVGYAQKVLDVGSYDVLALVSPGISGGTITAILTPLHVA